MKQYLGTISLFLFLFLFVLVPASFAYAEEKYQNDSFGYFMEIPEEYTVSQSLENVIIITPEKKNNFNGIDSISVLVTVNDGKPFLEMIQLVKNDIQNFGHTVTDEIQIDLGNNDDNNNSIDEIQNKATLIKSYTAEIGFPVFSEIVVAYHENLAYFITLTYTEESTHDDFHNMLESFEFETDDFIPNWVRIVSERWADEDDDDETVSDEDFAYAIKFMLTMSSLEDLKNLEEDIHNHTPTSLNNDEDKTVIIVVPQWLKSPTSSWVSGEIDNATWKNMLQYLYEKEIIVL